ncbi:MAG: hypothetical protein WDN04_04535 [Rhodospirillales bacterium]
MVLNLAAGVASVRPGAFLAGSLLGYVPQTAIFALLGSGVQGRPGYGTGRLGWGCSARRRCWGWCWLGGREGKKARGSAPGPSWGPEAPDPQ